MIYELVLVDEVELVIFTEDVKLYISYRELRFRFLHLVKFSISISSSNRP